MGNDDVWLSFLQRWLRKMTTYNVYVKDAMCAYVIISAEVVH